jgi:hypothetical protein
MSDCKTAESLSKGHGVEFVEGSVRLVPATLRATLLVRADEVELPPSDRRGTHVATPIDPWRPRSSINAAWTFQGGCDLPK